jgi:hypothetical protein
VSVVKGEHRYPWDGFDLNAAFFVYKKLEVFSFLYYDVKKIDLGKNFKDYAT